MKSVRPTSLIIIIFIIALVISYKIYYHFANNVNDIFIDNIKEKEEIKEISTINVEKINKDKIDKILGIVEIPRIKLKKAFYNIDSSENNVNKNIMLLKESIMPDIKGGILFLAAHSGNSNISFFRNLNLLKINDEVIIYYKDSKYYYVINDIYELDKNGKISVNKNINENILVLTTCSINKNKQLVVVSKLIKIN